MTVLQISVMDPHLDLSISALSGANATFIAEMNRAWRANPASVDPHWASYFGQLAATADTVDDIEAGPSWAGHKPRCGRA